MANKANKIILRPGGTSLASRVQVTIERGLKVHVGKFALPQNTAKWLKTRH